MEMATLLYLHLVFLFSLLTPSTTEDCFDVRQHLSTVTRYGAVKGVGDSDFVPSTIPNGCNPIHINLEARHGTRSPTKKRMAELHKLASRLEVLLNNAKRAAQKGNSSLDKIPTWLWGWKSPWKGKRIGGDLISEGEEEMYHMGIRVRKKFKDLFGKKYHPDMFTIRASQVPRASASAVAFGMGLFKGKGTLGRSHNRAFSIITENLTSGILPRFNDNYENHKGYRKRHDPAVDKLKEPILEEISLALAKRYQLNFSRQDAASLWFLCGQEASLLDITDQACGLFTPSEVSLLEWADDMALFILRGYGASINYPIAVPLLQDVVQSMEHAIKANEDGFHTPGSGTYEKARLRFSHAEYVVPFSCLLGLFCKGADFEQIQREQPLKLPPKPPLKRSWMGSIVAPFAGNNMLVLYHCPANYGSNYFVQVLHNEVPVPMLGCNNTDFCSFEVFKERIVNPHLKHNFDSISKIKLGNPQPRSVVANDLSHLKIRSLERTSSSYAL